MARFIKLAITEYDDLGAPAIGADDCWINIDQITVIEEHLGNNITRRHATGGWIPEEHYSCLLITTADGAQHLAPVGVYPSAETGMDALERFLPVLTQPSGDNC